MAKFQIAPTIHSEKVITARLGGSTDGTRFLDADVGKAVKLSGDSAYALCADGNPIEGFVSSVRDIKSDGFHLGGVVATGYANVVVGTGTVSVGTYVVSHTNVALGTKLSSYAPVKAAADQAVAAAAPFKWRVVSLGAAGSGAAGTVVVIERV